MRFDLLEQVMTDALVTPRITLEMVADGLRKVIVDPTEAERSVGHLYGHAFKKREEVFETALCRRCGLLQKLHDGPGSLRGRSCDGL